MLDHNFCSVINGPTRIADTGATVLDQVRTNSYSDLIKSGVILNSMSDHVPLLARNFNDMNLRNFDLELENINETKTVNRFP